MIRSGKQVLFGGVAKATGLGTARIPWETLARTTNAPAAARENGKIRRLSKNPDSATLDE
jgi:hypothetical protein